MALVAQSAAVSTRSTSAVNPRVFVFTTMTSDDIKTGSSIVLSYTRGEPFVEIAASSSTVNFGVNFYLLRFTKPCEQNGSCDAVDFLTDEFEKNWDSLTLYQDDDLKDTVLDCTHCHSSTGGFGTRKSEPIVIHPFGNDRNLVNWFDGRNSSPDINVQRFIEAFGEDGYGSISKDEILASNAKGLWDFSYLTFHWLRKN